MAMIKKGDGVRKFDQKQPKSGPTPRSMEDHKGGKQKPNGGTQDLKVNPKMRKRP